MESRDVQVVIAVILAGIVGFGVGVFVTDDDDDAEPAATTGVAETAVQATTQTTTPTTTTTIPPTTTTPTGTQRAAAVPTDDQCIARWNRATNASGQSFLADLQDRQAVRVNLGGTEQVPRRCVVTVIANDGSVYRFTEGAAPSFPWSGPARLELSALGPPDRVADALPEPGGTLSAR